MKPQTSATLPTPGPWEARPEKLESGFHVAGRGPQVVCGNKVIADIRNGHTKLQRDEAEANARLIAAAPEMLKWHREIVKLASGWDKEGAIGPKSPLSWEAIARMAMDYALAGIKAAGQSPTDETEKRALKTPTAEEYRAIRKARGTE